MTTIVTTGWVIVVLLFVIVMSTAKSENRYIAYDTEREKEDD